MRRIYYGLGVIGLLALGFLCCWPGTKQDAKQVREPSGVVDQDLAAISEATEDPPTPSIEDRDTVRIASVDAGQSAVNQDPLIRQLHVLERANPGLAVSLAREDRRRFPKSPHAEERDMLLVTALHNDRDINGSKNEAWNYFMNYPNGQFTEFLIGLTGIHPPSVR